MSGDGRLAVRFLANYIMRGRLQAMFATALCAVVSLLLFPVSWPVSYLSGAAVGLVTLVQGPREGLLNILGATLLFGVLAAVGLGLPQLALSFVLSVWLPAWVLAQVLRQTVSLPAALLVAAGFGVVLIIGIYLILKDPSAVWLDYFKEAVLPRLKQAGMEAGQMARMEQAAGVVSGMLTGVMAAMFTLGSAATLLLARWWQAVLYRPEGFRREFHALRFGKVAGGVAAVVFVIAALVNTGVMGRIADDLLFVVTAVFMLQGLAVVHATVKRRSASTGWLVGLYVLMAMLPHVAFLLAAAGMIDNWMNFRSRLGAGGHD